MDVEQIAFTIIAHAGEAKSSALLKQPCLALLNASKANGEKTDISVLLIHSQDHLMTCMLAIDLIKEKIEMRKEKYEGE